MSIWENFNVAKLWRENKELALLKSLYSSYEALNGYESFEAAEDHEGRREFIAKLEKIIAADKKRSRFAAYYLNGLLGMSKYIFTNDLKGALTSLEKSAQFVELDHRSKMDIYTKSIFIPGKNIIFRQLASISRQLKDYEKAYKYIGAGINNDPTTHEFYMEKMLIFADKKDYRSVLTACTEIENIVEAHHGRMFPWDLKEFWERRAEAHSNLKNYKECLTCYDKLIKYFPSEKGVYKVYKKMVQSMLESNQRIVKRPEVKCKMSNGNNKKKAIVPEMEL